MKEGDFEVRKAIVSVTAALMVLGPFSSFASANPLEWIKRNGLPEYGCEWQEALGVVNVKECESQP